MIATPLVATALIVVLVIILALSVPLERLAESTSLATLVVFALVNLALLRLRHRRVQSHGPHVTVPILVPAAGLTTCVVMVSAFLGDFKAKEKNKAVTAWFHVIAIKITNVAR